MAALRRSGAGCRRRAAHDRPPRADRARRRARLDRGAARPPVLAALRPFRRRLLLDPPRPDPEALADGVGLDELTLRLPSLVAGLALLIGAPWIVWRRFGAAPAGVFAALLSFSPLLVLYSRIARAYAIGIALVFFALMALERWLAERKPGHALAYVSLSTLAVWFHQLTAPALMAPLALATGLLRAGCAAGAALARARRSALDGARGGAARRGASLERALREPRTPRDQDGPRPDRRPDTPRRHGALRGHARAVARRRLLARGGARLRARAAAPLPPGGAPARERAGDNGSVCRRWDPGSPRRRTSSRVTSRGRCPAC